MNNTMKPVNGANCETYTLAEKSAKLTSAVIDHNNNDEVIDDVKDKKPYVRQLYWPNIIILGSLHILAVYGYYIRHDYFMANLFSTFLGVVSNIGITGGAHRLWTHKSYKANWIAQSILMFLATLTYQNSIFIWARDHRMHHKYSETDADPHNAERGFFFSHVGWLMVRKHPEVIAKGKTIDMSDLEANPIVMFQHKYYYPMVLLCAALLPACFAHYVLGASWTHAIFRVVICRYIVAVNLTWCINSVAHLYGNKPYDKRIGPTDSGLMRLFGIGEGFHNYHHTFPYDYKAAEFHNDYRNLTTYTIDLFARLGWVTDRKTVSQEAIEEKCARLGGPGREVEMLSPHTRTEKNYRALVVMLVALYCV